MTESSLKMQTRWSFAATIVTGQFSKSVEVIRHRHPLLTLTGDLTGVDEGYPLVVTKNKVRGRGKVLQMTFRGSTGKDFEIIGWGVRIQKNDGD